ncbi:MAG: lipid-A-disaccharide synthase, partial [Bacteroidales bacterium]|nr:lipid-A-disaccharide synthase [Bacteroidales bacterium]
MRYFIIAGEQSGDLHGSNLIKGLKKTDPEAVIKGWGGDLMENAGMILLNHYSRTAFMGFVVILRNLGKILRNLTLCKKHIAEFSPDAVILIDYPAFNLRIAEFARERGYKVYYYISPKLWAWKENRVKKVKQFVDRMYIIFPFEVEFYEKHGIDVEYFGNPLVDEIEGRMRIAGENTLTQDQDKPGHKPVIALLPGSRKHEVVHILPQMLKVIPHFPDYQFVIAGVRNLQDQLYQKIIDGRPVTLAREETYDILVSAGAALVASGTATLEAALLGTPQVVCYKGDFFSALIAWMLIRVKFVSLVNLILGYEAVKELLQYSLNGMNLVKELKAVLPGGARRDKLLSDYSLLGEKLGPSGASWRVAEDMVRRLGEDRRNEKERGRRGEGEREDLIR